MSDVTNQYIVRAKHVPEAQYLSLGSALSETMQRQGWMVEQVSFITGSWSLNEEEIKKNLAYFKVPSGIVEPIRTKLAMIIFDEYENILTGMYSIRFNGRSDHGGTTARPSNDQKLEDLRYTRHGIDVFGPPGGLRSGLQVGAGRL